MNQNYPLQAVEKVLNKFRPIPSGNYNLYVKDKVICLERRVRIEKPPSLVAILTSTDINVRLSSRLRYHIEARLCELNKRGLL